MFCSLVSDMCTNDSAVEISTGGGISVDSVLLRITKQQNNCVCHVSLQNTDTNNYTIYMAKYEEQSNAAPEQQNCGLAIDVKYLDTSDITRTLQSIECASGTRRRSITLGGNELILKSRIISGNFTRGYCMQIYRGKLLIISIYLRPTFSCNTCRLKFKFIPFLTCMNSFLLLVIFLVKHIFFTL